MAKPEKSPDPRPLLDAAWEEMTPRLQEFATVLHKAGFSGTVTLRLEVLRADQSQSPVELIPRMAEADLRDQSGNVPPVISIGR